MADVKKKQYPAYNNPAEILKETAKDVLDVPAKIFDEALTQIGLKPQKVPMSGEINMKSGEHKVNNLEAKLHQLQAVQSQEKQVYNLKEKAMQEQVAKLMQELHGEVVRLQAQTAELTSQTRAMTVEMAPPKAGVYHLNFIDWVMATLRDLKKTVSESRMWLHTFNQKKKQKGYWQMTKKHGNNFQFSDERSVATSAG